MIGSILIADDDRDLVTALAARCRELDLEVFTAHDALTALNRVGLHRFDVACLDVNMPAGNGLSACEMMSTEPSWASIPVIIMTGRTDPEVVKQCHRLCAYYVLKGNDVWSRIKPLLCELLNIQPQLRGYQNGPLQK